MKTRGEKTSRRKALLALLMAFIALAVLTWACWPFFKFWILVFLINF